MSLIKDVCTVVPAVVLTAGVVVAIGIVMGLSSWALL